MKNERFLLLILGAVQFSHIVDFMLVMPLGKQLMEIFEISPKQFSFIVSVYAIAAFFSSLFSAVVIDRFDRKSALLWLYAGFTLGTLACSMASSYTFFLMARSFTGAFGGVMGALILSIVGDVVPLERRGRAMGIIMTAFSAASIVGVPASLFLAATFNWRIPFISIAVISSLMIVLAYRYIPALTTHIKDDTAERNPFTILGNIFKNRNQLRALFFTLVLMLGHFTIIPFIAPYMQLNIGFSDYQVTYIYLIGGVLSIFFLPYFGKLADRFGSIRVFTIASVLALGSIFAITNLNNVPVVVGLVATSSFFIVASGRNVPATTLVTSVVQPQNRGSFMSVRTSVKEMAFALSSVLAGWIISKNPDGSLENYEYVGYVAIGMSILAIIIGRKLKSIS